MSMTKRQELLSLAAQMQAAYPLSFEEAVDEVLRSPVIAAFCGYDAPERDSEEVRVLAAETLRTQGFDVGRPTFLDGIKL
jgi:hypothetical protein